MSIRAIAAWVLLASSLSPIVGSGCSSSSGGSTDGPLTTDGPPATDGPPTTDGSGVDLAPSADLGAGADLSPGTDLAPPADLGVSDGGPPDAPAPDATPPPTGLPSYGAPELVARTNIAGNPGGSYRVPESHHFSGEDIRVNDARTVCFRLTANPEGTKEIWCGDHGATGQVVYASPVGAFMLGSGLGPAGKVIFSLSDVPTPGVYLYDPQTGKGGLWTTEPLGALTRVGLALNAAGKAGFRANFGNGQAHVVYDPAAGGSTKVYAKEDSLDPSSELSFISTPDFNDLDQLASMVRLGPGKGNDQPDQIRRFEKDGTVTVMATDVDGDPASPLAKLDSTRVSLNDKGQVAFVATLTSGARGVFLADGKGPLVTIATEADPQLSEIEFFGASLSDTGVVVFRGKDPAGLRAIWAGDGQDLEVVVREHDLVQTDQGQARIDQHAASVPAFGGQPGINSHGDVVFNAGLTPPNDPMTEWGTGVFLVTAK